MTPLSDYGPSSCCPDDGRLAAIHSAASNSDHKLAVIAQTAYPALVAGARVRVVEMARHLNPLGLEMRFAPSMTNAEYELFASPGISARKALMLGRTFARASRPSARENGALTLVHRLRSVIPTLADLAHLDVYDFDDALYVETENAHHRRFKGLKREVTRSIRYMSAARLVLAGSPVLADAAMHYADQVEVVPSCVDPTAQPLKAHRDVEVLTLGWTGSSTTTQYIEPIIGVIDSLRDRGCRVRLVLMGARTRVEAPWIEQRPWSIDGEREMLTEIDVGLMPLPDDPWTRGKCGYKLLRYFSAGLPAIASPVGVNADLNAQTGSLSATTPAQWSAAIEQLIGETATRAQMGADARRFVERKYSYAVWAPRVAELLTGLA